MSGLRQTLAAAAALLLLAEAPHAAEVFTITSSPFKDGALLPKKLGGNNKTNPNCVGENVSPQFTWNNVPADTTSFALVMTDPKGRGTGVDHWIAYGIPASVTSFAEGETSKPSEKYVGGVGTAKQNVYVGPCTPSGPPHHYTFVLIATDLDPKALPAGSTGIIGLYRNP